METRPGAHQTDDAVGGEPSVLKDVLGHIVEVSALRTKLLLLATFAMVFGGACQTSSNSVSAPSIWDSVRSSGELKVCLADGKPYQSKNPSSGQWEGISVDYMKGWADALGVKLTPVDSTWTTIVAGLQAHKCDMATGLNLTVTRSLSVVFGDPSIDSHVDFALFPDKVPARTWDQLNDSKYTICVAQGSAEDSQITDLNPKAQILRLPSFSECQLALQSGKVQAAADDWSGNVAFINANPSAGLKIVIPNPAIGLQASGTAIPMGYRWEDMASFNVYTRNWIDSGQRNATLAKWQLGAEQNYAVTP